MSEYEIYIDSLGAISLEEWLATPSNGFPTKEDELACEFAESGADRELDFDVESQQEIAYECWLDSLAV